MGGGSLRGWFKVESGVEPVSELLRIWEDETRWMAAKAIHPQLSMKAGSATQVKVNAEMLKGRCEGSDPDSHGVG